MSDDDVRNRLLQEIKDQLGTTLLTLAEDNRETSDLLRKMETTGIKTRTR